MEESASPVGCLRSMKYQTPHIMPPMIIHPPRGDISISHRVISGKIGLQELIHLCRWPPKKKHSSAPKAFWGTMYCVPVQLMSMDTLPVMPNNQKGIR